LHLIRRKWSRQWLPKKQRKIYYRLKGKKNWPKPTKMSKLLKTSKLQLSRRQRMLKRRERRLTKKSRLSKMRSNIKRQRPMKPKKLLPEQRMLLL